MFFCIKFIKSLTKYELNNIIFKNFIPITYNKHFLNIYKKKSYIPYKDQYETRDF